MKRILTPEQRKRYNQVQRDWYHRNTERIKVYKHEFFLQNRDAILEKNRKYVRKPKQIIPILDEQPEQLEVIKKMPLFQILDILKKDYKHRLHKISVKNWKEKEWQEFNKLKSA
jgi:hypothetical protein